MFVRRGIVDRVPTPEGEMHFVKQGSGYPLVLLHPLGISTWAWHTVIDSLRGCVRKGQTGTSPTWAAERESEYAGGYE